MSEPRSPESPDPGYTNHSRGGTAADHDPTGLDLASMIAKQTADGRVALPPPVDKPRPVRRPRSIGEQRSGAHPDRRDPQLLGRVMGEVSRKKGWRKRISLSVVLKRWDELVGPENAQHSKPVDFQDGVLTVVCDSTAWATGMRYSVSKLVARLNAELGDQTVTLVKVRGPNAPSWKKRRSPWGRC